MNKASFRFAFMAVLASSLSGCASPMKLFAKKPQPFDEFVAQRKAEQTRIAGSQGTPGGPAEVSELLHQGHAAFQQGNLPEAQSKYFAVVQRQPNHPVANHRLGVIADRQQDYLTAQRHYFAALNASPNDPNLLNDIGYSFLLQSRYPEAENYLQAALQKNPKQSNAINNLGLLYAKQGQPDRALAMFRMTNSEAEAQAKVARLMPAGLNAAPQAGTMMANQGWPPQSPATMNAAPNNPNPYNVAPTNPAVAANGGQALGNPLGHAPSGINQSQTLSPNAASGGWTAPDLAQSNHSSPIAQTAAVNDPNLPEATRRLKEQMEGVRLKAISERQSRDNAERQRQEMLKRQLRDEELGRANIVNPVYSQPTAANRWNGAPTSAPPNPNAPIVVGPPANANVPHSGSWPAIPDGHRPGNEAPGSMPNGFSNAMPNVAPNPMPEPMPNVAPNSMPSQMPNTQRGPIPPTSPSSPLDAMPTWPPPGSLPTITPNNSATGSIPTNPPPNSGAWPNGAASGMADDPARAASRMGMNAGLGNPFPITPGSSSDTTNAPNWPNSPNAIQNFGSPNGFSPTTTPNWPANSPPPNNGPLPGEPPAGSFGPSNFSTSANSQAPLLESPTRTALQDQLPPSELYQTPNRFGFGELPAGATPAQPASFGTNRNAGGPPASQFGGQGIPTADRFRSGNQWETGPVPGTQSPQTSTPTTQGYLATPFGENALQEYERMIQMQNAETNRIRQQIDEQRQLPGSENFRSSRTQPQTRVSSGIPPRQ